MNRLGMASALGLIFSGALPFVGCSSDPATGATTGEPSPLRRGDQDDRGLEQGWLARGRSR